MTLYLSEYVCGGEIINSRKNSVHGYLAFHGCDRPLILQLTGNCSGDMSGQHLRFDVRPDPDGLEPLPVTEEQLDELRLAWMQIGVASEMTIRREPKRLSLVWHSQNGRTIVELDDPLLEFVDSDEPQDPDTTDDLLDEDDNDVGTPQASFERIDDVDMSEMDVTSTDADEDDPFGLFPPDLTDSLGSKENQWKPDIDDATLEQWKEWDEVFDGTKDVPLSTLFDPPLRLPPPEAMNDTQVAELVVTILAQLALHNIAFHMCEHFTPRSAYELLRSNILPENGAHPDLPRIGYTMNFDTSEFCDQCRAKYEDDDDYETEFDVDDSDPESPTGDVPF